MTTDCPPAMIRKDRLLERFLRYVRIETTADAGSETYPSSSGQWKLGGELVRDFHRMGLADAHQDSHGLVHATIPATTDTSGPALAFFAHMDTSPEASGFNVRPRVIEAYDGRPIVLESGEIIEPDEIDGSPDLRGHTLVVTDGKTLLGGDDKAGVAILMEAAHTLIENSHLSHGPVHLCLTCDEEIGSGTDHIDLNRFDAIAGYTLDGGGRGVIDVETFSADAATVMFKGRNIHTSIAKGRMKNAIRVAADFIASMPRDAMTPETTEGREGFIHVHEVHGGVSETFVQLILRSFDEADLETQAELIRQRAADAIANAAGVTAEISIRRQYRNLGEGLAKVPEAVEFAVECYREMGIEPIREIVRGGTDGSQLTEKGLPTPNLSSGQYNIHSTSELASVDDMMFATEHMLRLCQRWGREAV